MTTLSLVDIPIMPKKPIKMDSIPRTTYSSQVSINEEYFTPRSTIQTDKILSDSDTILTDVSSTEDTDYEEFVPISKAKHVRFDTLSSKPEVHLKLENNEAEFFVNIPSEDSPSNSNKSIRKRDRLCSAFRKRFPRSNDDSSDTSSIEWNKVLAKTLVSMQDDVYDIINGFDEIEQPPTDDSLSNTSETILTKPHLSFRERQLEKLEMMRVALMLHPPNLLTYDMKESAYPYTDIIEPNNFNLLRLKKGIPDENLRIQCKPFQHKKFRYRTQRGLLRMKHDLRKIRRDIYGKNSTKSLKEAPSHDVLNYQLRLQKTLLEVRKAISEYDRIHSLTNNQRPSISQIIANMATTDSKKRIQIEDYRNKSRAMEYVHKNSRNQLISAPYIPRRTRNDQITPKKDRPIDIDTRFDPTTFIDLNKEAEEFFGRDIPFWDKPMEARLSVALPLERKQSIHFVFPAKPNIWKRFVISFRIKQKLMKNRELNQRQYSHDDLFTNEDYFDCISPSFNRRKSQSLDSLNTVEF